MVVVRDSRHLRWRSRCRGRQSGIIVSDECSKTLCFALRGFGFLDPFGFCGFLGWSRFLAGNPNRYSCKQFSRQVEPPIDIRSATACRRLGLCR